MIVSETTFLVKCRDCEFETTAESCGGAERAAEEHIEAWEDGYRNLNHVCVLTSQTILRSER